MVDCNFWLAEPLNRHVASPNPISEIFTSTFSWVTYPLMQWTQSPVPFVFITFFLRMTEGVVMTNME